MKTITINVTQEHIDRGERFNALGCPVALAANEVCTAELSVGPWEYHPKPITEDWGNGYQWGEFPLPEAGKKLVFDFDNGWAKPTSFQLQVPDWAVAEEPVRNPIVVASPEPRRDRIQGEHRPDDTHSSRAPSIASPARSLVQLLSIGL